MSDLDMIITQLTHIRVTATTMSDEMKEGQWESARKRVDEIGSYLASIRWVFIMHDAAEHDKIIAESVEPFDNPIRIVRTHNEIQDANPSITLGDE